MPRAAHYIAGQWVRGEGDELVSANPATGGELWRGETASSRQVATGVAAAREAFAAWSCRPVTERIEILQKFAERLAEHKPGLAKTIAMETGKPNWECLTEVDSMIGKVAISIGAYYARTGESRQDMPGGQSVLRHRPHGVLAVFGAYNFPGHLPNGHIVPALLAGNALVFKPSDLTPLCGDMVVRIWIEAGLPRGVLNLIQGTSETGKALAGHPDIDGLLFTGSARTGQILHQQLAGQPQKILALEMGGNNPLIVGEVSNLEAVVYMVLQSAYLSAGQRCTCARRLLVPHTPAGDALVEKLTDAVKQIKVGAPDDEDEPFMGPVISETAADQLIEAQHRLRALGGEIRVPMIKGKPGTGFVSPGLIDLTGVKQPPDEEYFGPLLAVIRYGNFDDAIRIANDTRFGLSAGLLSDSRAQYERFFHGIRAGIVNWNRPLTGASSAAPFGGIGISGNHRPSALYAADYCAYPVASLEAETLQLPGQLAPGIRL